MTPWSGSNFRAAVSRPTLPSPIRSVSGRPRFWYFLATEMTKRRLRFTSSCMASWSPARTSFAMAISCWRREQRSLADLVEVLVEDVPVGVVDAEGLGGLPLAAAARLLGGRLGQDLLAVARASAQPARRGVGRPLGAAGGAWLAAGVGLSSCVMCADTLSRAPRESRILLDTRSGGGLRLPCCPSRPGDRARQI